TAQTDIGTVDQELPGSADTAFRRRGQDWTRTSKDAQDDKTGAIDWNHGGERGENCKPTCGMRAKKDPNGALGSDAARAAFSPSGTGSPFADETRSHPFSTPISSRDPTPPTGL